MNKQNKFLITGSTGVIGSALVKKLLSCRNNAIICPVRNKNKALSLFSENLKNASGRLDIVECKLEEYLDSIDFSADYIIHCASPTSSKFFVEKPVETIMFGILTTSSLLRYSCNHDVKSIVYLSSLEVYGTVTNDSLPITENYQGYVNPLDVRSSYNMVKRMCENICFSYYKEYKVPVKIIRPTQVISNIISNDDNRIFAQFGRKAATGEDIELHTNGDSARQYVYIDDAIEAILTVLFRGKDGDAYNLANEKSYVSAREMANFVQNNFNPQGKVKINMRDDMGYAPMTRLRLDTTKLKELGWNPQTSLFDMFRNLIDNLK